MEEWNVKCKNCELTAWTYCPIERTSLCWRCDTVLHETNSELSNHIRSVLCQKCQKITPWSSFGPNLPTCRAFCYSCDPKTSGMIHHILTKMNQFSSITDDNQDDDQSKLDENQDSSSDQNARVAVSSIIERIKKVLITNVDDDDDDDGDDDGDDDDDDDDSTSRITSPQRKIVVIEHGTEDPIFQKTAEHIKEYLWLIGVRDYITVEINPMSTPRKGSFVITTGDTIYIRLLDLEPPYDELKHLDVNSIAAKIMGFNLKNKLGMM